MSDVISMNDMLGVTSGDKNNMLGKLLYFSLSDLLIDKEKLIELCAGMGIYYGGDRRVSVSDAFKSATGDIKDCIVVKHFGQQQIYRVYCRDNEHTARVLSRELVKETLNRETNQYEKLANIRFNKESGLFSYDNLAYDSDVDAAAYCRRAEELFELYQTCANRKQIETICLNFVRGLEATKMSVNGHLYFVPRHSMEKVDIFEDFIEALSSLNKTKSRLMANSIYIIDDAKQRDKMTEEFYTAVKKEIAEYQERADYLIKSGSQSPAIMERWVMKISALEGKKRHYEQVLRRELDGLDEEFESLKLLSQELSLRASGIRFQRAA